MDGTSLVILWGSTLLWGSSAPLDLQYPGDPTLLWGPCLYLYLVSHLEGHVGLSLIGKDHHDTVNHTVRVAGCRYGAVLKRIGVNVRGNNGFGLGSGPMAACGGWEEGKQLRMRQKREN